MHPPACGPAKQLCESCREETSHPRIASQDLLDMVPRLHNPWLAVYPNAMHGVLMQEGDSILPLLDNFLENA